jgi:hypothetical protein
MRVFFGFEVRIEGDEVAEGIELLIRAALPQLLLIHIHLVQSQMVGLHILSIIISFAWHLKKKYT